MSSRRATLAWRAAFAALAFFISIISSSVIFQRAPSGADENSYVFQAYNFLDGVIARPMPPIPKPFDSGMIILRSDAGWVSRYPPSHSLWLMSSLWADLIHPSIALAAAVAMWFLCAAACALAIPQALVAIPLLVSPFFFFMYGTYLSHTTGLAAVALLCWGYLRALQRGERWPMFVAGAAWSMLFLNRTFTALLIALPFGLDALGHLWRNRSQRALQQTALFAAASACGVLAYLAYNKLVTGDAFHATYLLYEKTENLGFGIRHTSGTVVNHTLANGLAYLWRNLLAMNLWLWGFKGSLILAALLSAYGWSKRWSPLLFGAVAAVWLGYVAFWFEGVPTAGGPIYFFETLAPLLLLIGFGAHRLWMRGAAHPRSRNGIAAIALLALLSTSTATALREAPSRIDYQQRVRNVLDTFEALPPHSLVFVEKFGTPDTDELVINPQGLDSDPLVLRSYYEDNAVVQRVFTNRQAFLLRGTDPSRAIPLDRPTSIHLQRSADKFHRRTGKNKEEKSGAVVRTADPHAAPGLLAFGTPVHLPAGHWRITWHGSFEDVSPETPIDADFCTDRGRLILWSTEISGAQSNAILTADITLTNVVTPVEARVRYGGSGRILLREVTFDEILPAPSP